MSGQCKCGSRAVNDDPDRLLCDRCWRDAEIERLREQLREQTKSFCTHCGTLFPKGKKGIAAFRAHVFECENHPTSEIIRWAQAMVTALAVGDVASGSKLHHKLRDKMIAYREAARAAGGGE